jgi:hypothetical protein
MTAVPWLDTPDDEGHSFDPADPRHGTPHAYRNLRCRCRRCKRANADSVRERQTVRAAMLLMNPNIVEHGRASTYGNWKCRCAPCTEAWRIDAGERRRRRMLT